MIETLAVVEAPHFCAGLVLWGEGDAARVIEAADVLKYMRRGKGWTRNMVRDYCRRRGWKISIVHQLERSDTSGGSRRALY